MAQVCEHWAALQCKVQVHLSRTIKYGALVSPVSRDTYKVGGYIARKYMYSHFPMKIIIS